MSDDPRNEVKPTNVVAVRENLGRVPAITAEQYSHIGKYAGAIVLSCFEQIGGLNRMSEWADANPTDFFTKVMPKVISKSQQVDVSGTVTIDDAIGRLERFDPIEEADFTEVESEQWDL